MLVLVGEGELIRTSRFEPAQGCRLVVRYHERLRCR